VPPVGGAIEPHHGLRRPARGGQVPDGDTLVACTPTHEVDRPPIGRPGVPTEAPWLLPGPARPSCRLDGTKRSSQGSQIFSTGQNPPGRRSSGTTQVLDPANANPPIGTA
jgi:hypothetical protein